MKLFQIFHVPEIQSSFSRKNFFEFSLIWNVKRKVNSGRLLKHMPVLFCLIPLITHFQGEVPTERFIMRPKCSTRKQIYDFVHNRGMKYFCHKFITTTPSIITHNLFHQNNCALFLPLHHNARKQFICPPPVFFLITSLRI